MILMMAAVDGLQIIVVMLCCPFDVFDHVSTYSMS